MNLKLFQQKEVILFDTEYTTWEGALERDWSGTNEFKEIVQIGAALIDGQSLVELDSADILVRPQKNSLLSDYFIKLTGISQEVVDKKGILFPKAIQKFYEWSRGLDLYCWGTDGEVLELNCTLHNIPLPFAKERFRNVRDEIFVARGIPAREYTSGRIVEAFGKKISRATHTGLNDARTIADGLRLLKEKIKGSK